MNRPNLRAFVMPSWSSATLCVVATVIFLGIASWSYISHYQLFYDFLFGPYGLATALLTAPETFQALRRMIFGNPLVYYIVLGLVASVFGLFVYEVLEGVGKMAHKAHDLVEEVHHDNGSSPLRQIAMRAGARLLFLGAWALYAVIFARIIVPLIVSLCEAGLAELSDAKPEGWLPLVSAFFVALVAMHLHVIFIRLVVLRPRLWV